MQGCKMFSNGVVFDIDQYLKVKEMRQIQGCAYTEKHQYVGQYIYKNNVRMATIIGIDAVLFYDEIVIRAIVIGEDDSQFIVIIDAYEPTDSKIIMLVNGFKSNYEIRKI